MRISTQRSANKAWRAILLRASCAVLVGLALPSQGFAQRQSPPTAAPPIRVPKKADPVVQPSQPVSTPGGSQSGATPVLGNGLIEWSQQVLVMEDIGLTIHVPANCGSSKVVEPVPPELADQAKPQTVIQILPAESESWKIVIRAPRVAHEYSIDEVASNSYKILQSKLVPEPGSGLNAKPPTLKLLERVPREGDTRKHLLGGQSRPLEYVQWFAEVPQNGGDPSVVRALTVAKVGDRRFLTFDLTTTTGNYQSARPIYDAVIAAATLENTEQLNSRKLMEQAAGLNLTRGLSEQDIKAILTNKPERWFRYFKPAKSGNKQDDTEVGYVCYQFHEGQKGEVDRTLPKSAWGAAQREKGFVVLADLRILAPARNEIIDSRAGYFLRTDREGEMWVTETAVRSTKSQGKPEVFRELGVREGATMQIEITDHKGASQTIQPLRPNDNYLSRVEALLVPQLLIKARAQAQYAYYTWVPEARTVRLRRDAVERPENDLTKWRVVTRFGDEDRSQTSLYTDTGDLIRTELADGTRIEPTTYEELLALWKSKGLPVGGE